MAHSKNCKLRAQGEGCKPWLVRTANCKRRRLQHPAGSDALAVFHALYTLEGPRVKGGWPPNEASTNPGRSWYAL